jgi:hypothetical protein
MSYYHAKRKLTAEQYLEERNRQMRDKKLRDLQAEKSRAWLDDYHSKPAKTGFNWAPRWPITPPEETNGQEIEEGEFTEIIEGDYEVVADAPSRGEAGGRVRPALESQGATAASIAAPQGALQDFETPF